MTSGFASVSGTTAPSRRFFCYLSYPRYRPGRVHFFRGQSGPSGHVLRDDSSCGSLLQQVNVSRNGRSRSHKRQNPENNNVRTGLGVAQSR
jgi:hypothetical protein